MPPVVLIIEARKEVAAALEAAIALAHMTPIVVPHVERLSDIPYTPAAIVVRIAFESATDPPHAAIERLPRDRPPIIAIAWEEDELEEARRLIAQAKALLQEIALTVWLAGPFAQFAGWVELLAGDPAAAERELRLGLEKLEEIGELAWLWSPFDSIGYDIGPGDPALAVLGSF